MKLFLLLSLTTVGWCQSTGVNLLNTLVHCPAAGNYFLMSIGGKIACVPVPSSITVNSSPPAITIPSITPYVPIWTSEVVSFSSLVSTAISINYTTLKSPINGIIFVQYNSSNQFNTFFSSIQWAGNPVQIALPTNWLSTDSVVITYQYQ